MLYCLTVTLVLLFKLIPAEHHRIIENARLKDGHVALPNTAGLDAAMRSSSPTGTTVSYPGTHGTRHMVIPADHPYEWPEKLLKIREIGVVLVNIPFPYPLLDVIDPHEQHDRTNEDGAHVAIEGLSGSSFEAP